MNSSENSQKLFKEDIKLAKKLNIFDYFSIGFGSMIGVGWVIMVGDWINMGGGVIATIIAFAIGAIILIPIALVYGELSVDMPVAGGAIAYSLNAFGSFQSYFTGWFLALGYISMCPWETIAIGQILEALFPTLKTFPLYSIGEYMLYAPTLFISLTISIVIIIINYRGIEYVTKVQNLLTIALFIITIIAVVTSIFIGSFQNILPFVAQTPKNPDGSIIRGLFSVIAITPFFYSGFDTIPQGIEEHNESTNSKAISKTILLSIVAASVFYVFVILAVSMVMPWQNTLGMSIPASEVYKTGLKSPIVSKLILIGALCGLITTLNSFYVAGARVLLTLGRAKFIDEAFSNIHPKYKTPYFSNTVIAIITLLGPFVGKKLLSPIINICSLGFMIAWLMVCLSSIKLKSESHVESNMKSMTCLRYLSVGLSTLMIMILILPSSPGALKWPFEWGLVGVWTIIGIILYIISNSRGSIISKEERQKQVMGEFYINKENM